MASHLPNFWILTALIIKILITSGKMTVRGRSKLETFSAAKLCVTILENYMPDKKN